MVFQAHPGDILAGKYRVERVLGIGGMGMVVAATHLELDQPVALKFMLGELGTSPNLLDRFLREARAVAKLRGEHVCRIFDVGRLDNGSPYIVMELLQGEDFAAVLSREGKLEPQVAVTYMLQAIEGVAEAHAEGIIHRDLKPGNLFITTDRDGTPLVKVLDFGISKSSSAPATRTGEVMGSPGYMAPEQMSNAKAADARTDIWALGVILYQALSSTMPWSGDSLPALCMSVISDPPPPLPETVPAGLRAIVLRCLEKQQEARWSNVGELASALAPFGDPDATATAKRISKIVVSTQPPTATPPRGVAVMVSELATVAAKPAHGPTQLTPAPIHPISTMSASAAELKLPVEVPPARSKAPVIIGGSILLAGGALALVLGMTSGGGDPRPAPVATTPAPAPVATPAPTPPPAAKPVVVEDPLVVGKRVADAKGCNACHPSSGNHGSGPSFGGAWGTVVELANGSTAIYDDTYVRESLAVPMAKIRRGFSPSHPNYDALTEVEITGLIAFIKSLAAEPPPVVAATPGAKPITKPPTKPPTTPPKPPAEVKPPPDKKKPDDMWMQMTHDKDKP
jgi:serine/threonine protein kinase